MLAHEPRDEHERDRVRRVVAQRPAEPLHQVRLGVADLQVNRIRQVRARSRLGAIGYRDDDREQQN